ncbi:MAG: ABC-type transport auxiliary lipoprotein family protein [Desulfobacterales bacterium]|nr:ABC-type transport auxiliary lipoprotein family protein [Desulfobacterales bacterium]
MNAALKSSLFVMIAALLLSACASVGQPSKKIDFYTLEYDPPQVSNESEKIPFTIKISRFQVSPLYNSNKIIYRDKAFARNEYYYRKWRANPGDTITYLLKRDLQHSVLFKAVFSHEDGFSCDYLLAGAVDEFFEQDNPDSWEAVLSITIALIKENEPDVGKRIIFQKTYRTRKPTLQKNPKSLSEAMSLAMAQVSEEVIRDTFQALKTVR